MISYLTDFSTSSQNQMGSVVVFLFLFCFFHAGYLFNSVSEQFPSCTPQTKFLETPSGRVARCLCD